MHILPVHRFLFVWLCLATPSLGADAIYKSVDADGRVTYSSQPSPDAVRAQTLAVPNDEPAEEERQAATQRAGEIGEAVERLEQERLQKQARGQQQIKEATRAVDEAKARLEASRVQQEDDWQPIAKGGRYLKDSYYQRVGEAEQALTAAERALENAHQDAR